jgi:hypothetical protein
VNCQRCTDLETELRRCAEYLSALRDEIEQMACSQPDLAMHLKEPYLTRAEALSATKAEHREHLATAHSPHA